MESEAMNNEQKLLVGWFCPWAQRAWIVANLLVDGQVQVVNDCQSVILDTDAEAKSSPTFTPCDSNANENEGTSDGIARFMLKGPLLGNLSVPALLSKDSEGEYVATSGDSIGMCKMLWESQTMLKNSSQKFLVENTEEAREWSDKITKPFYNALMNRPQLLEGAGESFRELVHNLEEFGRAMKGPFYEGESLSVVDVTIWPFIYRVFALNLFQVYRSSELSASALEEIAYPRPNTSTGREAGMLQVMEWHDRCLSLPAFAATLPADASSDTGHSPSLLKIYTIYAMGVGLRSINYSLPS